MSSTTDPRGHAFSSHNPQALEACNAGIEGYIHWRSDATGHLDAAISADPDFALPKIVKAWALCMGRSAAYAKKIDALAEQANGCLAKDDPREVAYLRALRAAASGRGIEAATELEALLERFPHDLLAHRLVQFELFWNGRAEWMLDIVERSAPRWDGNIAGFGAFCAVRAFSNEEAGRHTEAEKFGRLAVELNDADVWGAHAVAHVLVMQRRIDEGVQWLQGLCQNWGEANQLKHHLWWHLCLFLLERGEHAEILNLLTTQIRNPDSPLVKAVPDATIDIQNVASILLRLELRGVDVGKHWSMVADVCKGRVRDHANAFSNAHDMMVLAALGADDEAKQLVQSIQLFTESGDGSLALAYRAAGLAVCKAVLAHRRGEYENVVALLAPVRHDLPLIGGSHAQRDVFYQLLIDAARRIGKHDLVRLLLRDVARIGFNGVSERTLYRDAAH